MPTFVDLADRSPLRLARTIVALLLLGCYTALSKPVAPAALRAWLEAVAQTAADPQASRGERREEETVP